MKKFRIIKTAAVLALAVLTVFGAAACGDSGSSTNGGGSNAASNALPYKVDGAEIKSVAVEIVVDNPNLQVEFANNTDNEVRIDCSKLGVKVGDKTYFAGGYQKLAANTPYYMVAMTFSDKPDLNIGDTVDVVYGDDVIDTVQVKEF